ncbi:hypothetical protein R1sor_023801 [Riccia sorocarpa]|uniref:Uncharacterized protein n=1 Tax=Riccia sorocarpa TaxID=122646 RepID=A0ABD3GRY8_9MARC
MSASPSPSSTIQADVTVGSEQTNKPPRLKQAARARTTIIANRVTIAKTMTAKQRCTPAKQMQHPAELIEDATKYAAELRTVKQEADDDDPHDDPDDNDNDDDDQEQPPHQDTAPANDHHSDAKNPAETQQVPTDHQKEAAANDSSEPRNEQGQIMVPLVDMDLYSEGEGQDLLHAGYGLAYRTEESKRKNKTGKIPDFIPLVAIHELAE